MTAGLGVCLLATPDVLHHGDPARTNEHVVGSLMATFGMIATSESTRSIRWVNAGLGLWLVMAPLVLGYPSERGGASALFGIAAIMLAAVRGRMTERFGGGWAALWRSSKC